MPGRSSIEEWFYSLVYLEDDDVGRRFPGHSRTKKNFLKLSETSSTSFYTSTRTSGGRVGVKMVADELLAAMGTVVGATAVLYGGSPYLGITSGKAAGELLGSMMWSWLS